MLRPARVTARTSGLRRSPAQAGQVGQERLDVLRPALPLLALVPLQHDPAQAVERGAGLAHPPPESAPRERQAPPVAVKEPLALARHQALEGTAQVDSLAPGEGGDGALGPAAEAGE